MHTVTPSTTATTTASALPPLLFCLALLVGCATGMHSAPAPDDAEVIPITEQWLDAERRSNASAPAAGQDLGSLAVTEPGVYTYILGVGDVLAITLWDHPELTGAAARDQGVEGAGLGPPAASFVIDQQGKLHFPFAGTMDFAGLTREQASALLTRRLARYFRDPRVTLSVQAYRSQRVYIDGEVRTPGLQTVNDIPMTLLEALNLSLIHI